MIPIIDMFSGTYLDLGRWPETEHGYHATVSSAGAWEVGAPHRRERIMLQRGLTAINNERNP